MVSFFFLFHFAADEDSRPSLCLTPAARYDKLEETHPPKTYRKTVENRNKFSFALACFGSEEMGGKQKRFVACCGSVFFLLICLEINWRTATQAHESAGRLESETKIQAAGGRKIVKKKEKSPATRRMGIEQQIMLKMKTLLPAVEPLLCVCVDAR